MKKGFFKSVISIMLACTLLCAMLVPALADDGACDCGTSPIIQVRGVGETLYDENGDEIFSAENIIAGILPIIPQLADYLITQNNDSLVSAVKTALGTIFGPVQFDSNGQRTSVVSVNCSSAPVETYMDFDSELSDEQTLAKMSYQKLGDKHSYYFTYDWTDNPYNTADKLHQYIQEVKAQSGHDKVSLCCESMGGIMGNVYLAVYGYEDIDNFVMSNSAFNGLEMMGQLFIGNPEIDGEALARMISQYIRGNVEYGSLLVYLPIFEQLALMANDIFASAGDQIYQECLIPTFGYMAAFWGFVPEYHYKEAQEVMLADAGEDLKATLNNYYDQVLSKNNERVAEMVASDDVNYFCVSNYNRYIAPVTPSANWNSDGIIETYNTSGYATVANLQETLGDDYTQAVDTGENMISPDNVIDASTCQAPYQTWFIKNLPHVSYFENDGTGAFHIWLLTADEQYSIDTNAQYPQFMYYDTETPLLMPYEYPADNDTEEPNPDNGEETPNPDGGEEANPDNGEEAPTPDDGEEAPAPEGGDNADIPNTNSGRIIIPVIVTAIATFGIGAVTVIKKRKEE